jgi:subtilisin family serine protease
MKSLPFLFIFSLLTFSLSEAAVVTPDLHAVLQAAAANQEVSIIVNLADKVDINSLPAVVTPNYYGNAKVSKRNAIATAFREKSDKTQGSLRALLLSRGGKKMRPLWITNSIAVTVPAAVITDLMNMPEIESIELDAVIQAPILTPLATGTPRWNINKINAPALWSAGITGTGAVVASLDTGVDVNHPDLKNTWRGGTCSAPPDCPSWYDPYGNTTLPYAIPATGGSVTELDLTHAHGTHTMGIMVGDSTSPGNYAIGVAPGAKWISAKIFDDDGNAMTSVILSAFQWVLAPAGDAANAPDVVNNSWVIGSQNTCDTSLLSAITTLTAAGIEVVFAAGNMLITTPPTTSSSSFSPGNNPGVFAIGATDSTNTIAPYSSLGPSACPARTTSFPNIVAPGSNVWSSVPLGGNFSNYWYLSGTSMAAPHVSGAAALLVGAMPALTPAQIEEAFEQTALPLGSPDPNNTYGYGLLDVAAAYLYIFGNLKGNVPEIGSVPASYDFGAVQLPTSLSNTFTIVNRGTTDLTITAISVTGPNSAEFVMQTTDDTCSGQTIPSLSNCTVTVQFLPTSIGPKEAVLSVQSNDPVQPTLDLPLNASVFAVIPGTTSLSPATAWNDTGEKLYVAIRAANGKSIWVGSTNSSGAFNNDWTQIPGTTSHTPAIAWNGTAQKLYIAVKGANGTSIWLGSANSAGVFNNDWGRITGATSSGPAIAWDGTNNKLHIAIKGANGGSIWVGSIGSSGVFNNEWTKIPGATSNTPAIAWDETNNKLHIAVKGANGGSIWVGSISSSGVFNNDWTKIPGATSNTPAIAWDGTNNKLHIAVSGVNGGSIWVGSIGSSGVFNNDWIQLPVTSPSAPSAAFNSLDDLLHILLRKAGNTIEQWATP